MNKNFMIRDLIETDKIFCEECKLDKEKAWIKYLTVNSVMISNSQKNIIGKNNISEVIKNIFKLKNMSFIWKPLQGDVSDDLTLGYTTGTYIKKYIKDDKKIIEEGRYLTIWKKVDGKWKIEVDMEN